MKWLLWLIFSVIGITLSLCFQLNPLIAFLLTFGLAFMGISMGSTLDGD